jgi:hypothetical protein
LSIVLASKHSNVNLLLTQDKETKCEISHILDKSMWHVHELVRATCDEKIVHEYPFGKQEFNCIKLTCQVFRSPGYFVWNAILPIVLISFASLGPFVLSFTWPQSRIPSTASMLLSAVSFKAAVSRLLPTVSYLTSLDKYSLASIVIITAQLVYHALIGSICEIINPQLGYFVDKLVFLLFLGIVCLMQFVYVDYFRRALNHRNELIKNKVYFHNDDDKLSKSEKKND